MIHIFKPIFDWITGNFTLFENTLYNAITMLIIGLIAFKVAWKAVGGMYSGGMIVSSVAGSILHWIFRLIVFCLLIVLISVAMWIIKLLISIPIGAWIFIAVFAVTVGVGIIAMKIRQKKTP